MTDRLKNLKTSAIGVVVLGLGIYLLSTGKIGTTEFIAMTVMAWVFLAAKDSLLEGITAGIFKIPEKPAAPDPGQVLKENQEVKP